MKVETLVRIIDSDFYTGVPDSQLKALCNYLINTYGTDGQIFGSYQLLLRCAVPHSSSIVRI